MKTVLSKIAECLEKDINFITKDCDQSDRYYQAGMMYALNLVRDNFNEEKNQIINFAKKCQLIREIDLDENVKFLFEPETSFNETFKP